MKFISITENCDKWSSLHFASSVSPHTQYRSTSTFTYCIYLYSSSVLFSYDIKILVSIFILGLK